MAKLHLLQWMCVTTADSPQNCSETKPPLHDPSSERVPINDKEDMQDGYEIIKLRSPMYNVGHPCFMNTEDELMQSRWVPSCGDRLAISLQPEMIRELVFPGMPMKNRLALWKEWIKGKLVPVGDIEQLQHRASEKSIKEIKHDVQRTKITWLDASREPSLRHVLTAYAGWDPSVGYCQGMNFITAVFVSLGFEENVCFAGLRFLMEEICPGYHTSELAGYHRDALVLEQLVQFFLPTMYAKLREAHVSVQCMATEHFISLTSSDWPLASTVRLWDVMLMDGVAALFASFVALLELYMPSSSCRCDGDVVATSTSSNGTSFNLMNSFKQKCLLGVRNDFETVMALTLHYTELIPDSLIGHLREHLGEHASCTSSLLNSVCSVCELPDCLLAHLPVSADEDHLNQRSDEHSSENFSASMLDSVFRLYEFPDELLVHPTNSADETLADDDFATSFLDSIFGVHEVPDGVQYHPSECEDGVQDQPSECEDGNTFVDDFATSVLDTMFGGMSLGIKMES